MKLVRILGYCRNWKKLAVSEECCVKEVLSWCQTPAWSHISIVFEWSWWWATVRPCDILGFSMTSRLAGHSIMDLLRFLWFTTVSDVVSFDVLPASHWRNSETPLRPAENTCFSMWSSLLVNREASSFAAFWDESMIFRNRLTKV